MHLLATAWTVAHMLSDLCMLPEREFAQSIGAEAVHGGAVEARKFLLQRMPQRTNLADMAHAGLALPDVLCCCSLGRLGPQGICNQSLFACMIRIERLRHD